MMRRVRRLGVVGMFALPAACGQPFTFDGGSPSAGGSGGSSAAAGDASATSSSGATGCAPGVAGECPDGSYCAGDTLACAPCADLERLHFHAPFALDLSPPTAGTTVFYPRAGEAPGTLWFTYVDKGSAIPRRRIASAPIKAGGLGFGTWSLAPAPINADGQDSGPFFLPDGSAVAALVDAALIDASKPVVIFDSNRGGAAETALFAANVDGAKAAKIALPAGTHDADVTVATLAVPPRFFWRSDAGAAAVQRLVTAAAGSSAPSDVVIPLDNGCTTGVVDAPWVTPDGGLLLFAAAYPAPPACAQPGSGPRHLFAVRLDDAGAPVGIARRLFPGDDTSYDATPALTPDRCHLLFSRFDAAANGRLHGAMRD